MKIAFDHEIFCLQKRGGVSRYFCCLADEFSKMGHTVAAFAPLHVNETLDNCQSLLINGKKLSAYPPKLGGLSVKYSEWKGTRDIRAWRPNVVHKTLFSPVKPEAFGAPTVVTVHDMIHELFPQEFRKKDNAQLLKRKAVLSADWVICISENTKQDLLKFVDVDEKRISVIHHGIGLSDSNITALPQSPDTAKSRPYILYVGARNKYKNFNALIKAVGCNPTLRHEVEVIAFGSDRFTNEELAFFEKCGVKHVRQESGGDALLIERYRSASVFVYPSLYEGFGFPPLEAMALGCPVVASNASVLPEILGDACLYFEPHDHEGLATQILRVLSDNTLKEELIQAGMKHSGQYSWQKTASRTLDVYQTVL